MHFYTWCRELLNSGLIAFCYSFNRFSSMFRPLYKRNPQKMENIHKQFVEELRKAIQVCGMQPTVYINATNPNKLHCCIDFIIYYSSACSNWPVYITVYVCLKDDIHKLVEEAQLEFKLNELDKLERAARNTPNPTWSVSSIKISSSCLLVFQLNNLLV